MQIPGPPGYSFAEHMTAKGYLVLAADHLGVGASSKPADGDRVGFETMSAASAAFVEQVRGLLEQGAPQLGLIQPAPDLGVPCQQVPAPAALAARHFLYELGIQR